MLEGLRARLRRERFLPSALGVVVSPVYLIRRGIYQGVLSVAERISGDVLDFGCGERPYEELFRKAQSYTGVDLRESGHDHGRSRVDVFYDGKTLPFPDGRFDAVVSFEVFEHVFNPEEALAEIRRVLKPGGQLLLTTPFAWDEHEAPYDFARYTSYGIRHLLERCGFEVLEIKKTTTYVLAVCQMWIAYVAQYCLPRRSTLLRAVGQVVFCFPMNVVALALNLVLPKRDEYFCNCLVLARRD
jgi:SAM-dependent methyltransferase